MQSFKSILSSVHSQWWLVLLASAVGITAATVRAFASEETKGKRAQLKKKRNCGVSPSEFPYTEGLSTTNFRPETLLSASATLQSNCASDRKSS